jgi:hypothetical protein
MIYEYALEPKLLNNWKDFRYLVSQFGYDCGKLIARYPKKWKRMVYDSLGDVGVVEKKRIEDQLSKIDNRMIKRAADSWDGRQDWLANAEREHQISPFHAIISQDNPRLHPQVIEFEELDDDQNQLVQQLWKVNTTIKVKRQAKDMADAIAVFLKQATKIVFIDSYFGLENPRYRNTFTEFMQRIFQDRNASTNPVVEIHCGDRCPAPYFQAYCDQHFISMLPKGIKAQFIRWEKGCLHNRYILTNLGGVMLGEGLAEATGNDRLEDDFVLLDLQRVQELLNDFTRSISKFVFVDDHEVEGM